MDSTLSVGSGQTEGSKGAAAIVKRVGVSINLDGFPVELREKLVKGMRTGTASVLTASAEAPIKRVRTTIFLRGFSKDQSIALAKSAKTGTKLILPKTGRSMVDDLIPLIGIGASITMDGIHRTIVRTEDYHQVRDERDLLMAKRSSSLSGTGSSTGIRDLSQCFKYGKTDPQREGI